jgi:hypothetical protein
VGIVTTRIATHSLTLRRRPDRPPTPRRAIVWLALVGLLLTAGCGVDDPVARDGNKTTTPTLATPATTAATAASTSTEPIDVTRLGDDIEDSFERLVAGDAQPLFDSFSSQLQKELPLDLLQGTWETTVNVSGPYQFTNGIRYEDDGTYRAVILEAVFRDRAIDIRFVFDENGEVSGLFFEQPPQAE